MRWVIKVFFKCAKSLLRLQKEFLGRSYNLFVSYTTIVFSRYIFLLGSTDKVRTSDLSADCSFCYAIKSVRLTGRWHFSNWLI